jgi:hypothetical protein
MYSDLQFLKLTKVHWRKKLIKYNSVESEDLK